MILQILDSTLSCRRYGACITLRCPAMAYHMRIDAESPQPRNVAHRHAHSRVLVLYSRTSNPAHTHSTCLKRFGPRTADPVFHANKINQSKMSLSSFKFCELRNSVLSLAHCYTEYDCQHLSSTNFNTCLHLLLLFA